MLGPLQHAQLFLSTLHSFGGIVEITALAPKRKPIKRYFTNTEIAAEWALETNWSGFSVFAGVNPRSSFDGHESSVAASVALFLDFDPGKHADPDAALAMLTRFGIPPSITVRSGNGTHFYLLLETPSDPNIAKPIASRLCKATESDRVGNTNRIARLSGSLNWKDDQAPKWCYITGIYSDRRYALEQVSCALDAMGAPPAEEFKAPPRQPEAPTDDITVMLSRVSEHAREIIEWGEKNPNSTGQISRSEADFFVVCELVRADATDEQILWVYENKEIGSLKYRSSGRHYLNRTIEKARLMTAQVMQRESYGRSTRYVRGSRGGARESRRWAKSGGLR